MENGHGNERPPSYDESQLRKILAMMQAMTDAMSMFTKETANTPTRASVATQPNAKAKRSIANNFATKGKQLYQAIQALVKSRHGPKSPENAINEFATRFRQLAKDMKYVADLAEDPAITAACGFDQSNSLKTRMRYCVDQIEYLEDNGLFPPVDSMNDSEQRRRRTQAYQSSNKFCSQRTPQGCPDFAISPTARNELSVEAFDNEEQKSPDISPLGTIGLCPSSQIIFSGEDLIGTYVASEPTVSTMPQVAAHRKRYRRARKMEVSPESEDNASLAILMRYEASKGIGKLTQQRKVQADDSGQLVCTDMEICAGVRSTLERYATWERDNRVPQQRVEMVRGKYPPPEWE